MSTNPIKVLKQTELLGHQFTVYGTAENPLFLTKEIADIIEYSASNSNKLTNLVDRDEKVRNIITTLGGNQEVWLLTEDGLYEVLFQSRKPIAKEFKKGVKQILHEIRTTGGYITSRPGDTSEEIMARALVIAQNTITRRDERVKLLEEEVNAQSAQISNLTPKAEFADCFLSCKGDITIGELANILNQSCLFSKGRNKLREWLRKNGYLIKRGTRKNKPTQKSMSLHLMRIASTLCNTGEKNVFREEVMVTARGQKHFITQFRALLSSKESYEIEW
ncbi:phage antirepressor KilAC domain-containing protein [Bacteroides stercoris]|uniref:phage antirepressor KilAC domain-containing protein n=2 Tax=Bacteroides stercoris TaxID=46506 RepID=UPI00189784CE|nr:phage antirepressor KilAC domain-containing protein [Bacteroides stercoris]